MLLRYNNASLLNIPDYHMGLDYRESTVIINKTIIFKNNNNLNQFKI